MSLAALPDGGHLAYEVRGAGIPLLLLRPLGGSMASWGRFADELAEHTSILAFDPRGTGGSSSALYGTTTRGMARDALFLLDYLGIDRAHVYGISMGGMVASWLAVDAPERVARLILASTLPQGTMIRTGAWRRGLSLARCFANSPPEMEACIAERILSHHFRDEHPDEVRKIREAARINPASRRSLLMLVAAAVIHDVRSHLHEITAEVLVLIGERDPLLTLESQRSLLGRLPRATYEVLLGAGHDLSTEAPHRTAARVLQAISDWGGG